MESPESELAEVVDPDQKAVQWWNQSIVDAVWRFFSRASISWATDLDVRALTLNALLSIVGASMPSRHVNTDDLLVALHACSLQEMVALALVAMSLVVPSGSGKRAHSAERTGVPNIVFILADDK